MGARQLVVQLALDTTASLLFKVSSLTPITMTASMASLRRNAQQHLFGAGLHVEHALFLGTKYAGGFQHHFDAHGAPAQFGGVAHGGDFNFFSVHDDGVIGGFHLVGIHAAHAVVLEQVGQSLALVRSLTAATSKSGLSISSLNTLRPIRPNPLIPIFVAIAFLPFSLPIRQGGLLSIRPEAAPPPGLPAQSFYIHG